MSKEVIEKIEELNDYKIESNNRWYSSEYDGFLIKTNKQNIRILISNSQNCCENWGYFSTNEENVDDYIGAEIYSINQVDTYLNVKPHNVNFTTSRLIPDEEVIFVNIETSKGTLQFAVYNSHNGYYGHAVKIISEQLNVEKYL